ncbi:MAG: hypothetical protein ABIP20_09775 [Chthoniobacteraceae bacterium]
MADNPYEAPSANLSGHETFGAQTGGVTQGVVEQLRRTKGWTRFISVLCIIAGVVMLIAAFLGGSVFGNMNGPMRQLGGFLGVIIFFYGVLGVLQLIIGAKLGGFSTAVNRLMYSAQESDLEDALDRQRSFWVFTGVMMLIFVMIAIISVITVIARLR